MIERRSYFDLSFGVSQVATCIHPRTHVHISMLWCLGSFKAVKIRLGHRRTECRAQYEERSKKPQDLCRKNMIYDDEPLKANKTKVDITKTLIHECITPVKFFQNVA